MERSQKVVLGVAVVVAVTVALLFGWWFGAANVSNAAESPSERISVDVPVIVSSEELHEVADTHYPLYWAGERPDTDIELTVTSAGGAFVRYLPDGAKAGTDKEYLTVATYYAVNGYNSLAAVGADLGEVVESEAGAIMVTFASDPKSTYFSFPRASFQVEVFSPKDGEAKTLTEEGTIVIVDGDR